MARLSDPYRDPNPQVLVRVVRGLAAGDDAGVRRMLLWESQSHGSPWAAELHADPARAIECLAACVREEGLPDCSDCGSGEGAILFVQDTTGLLDDPDDWHGDEPPPWHGVPDFGADLTCFRCGWNTGTCSAGTPDDAAAKAREWWASYHDEVAEGEAEGQSA